VCGGPLPTRRAANAVAPFGVLGRPADAAAPALDPLRDGALVVGAALEDTECEPPEPRDLDTPPPEVAGLDGAGSFGSDGVGSEGFGSDGAGTVGVATVGVGSDGVLTVGTGTGN
jgi:hypothetical protein